METFFEVVTNPKIVGPILIGIVSSVIGGGVTSYLLRGKCIIIFRSGRVSIVPFNKATLHHWLFTLLIGPGNLIIALGCLVSFI